MRAQLSGLLDAGATDVWVAVFPVGEKSKSLRRTTDLLRELVS